MALMDMKQFIKSFPKTEQGRQELEEFANRVGSSVGYLRQIAGNHRKASADFAIKLEKESGGKLRRQDIRPDYWPKGK
jgi:DNA-binding transcriptional regulator YdaS (Cro superfamily)